MPVLLSLVGCGFGDLCENQIVETAESPAGENEAVLFRRDCGATTGFSSQVSIIEAGGKLRGSGTIFIADSDHGAAPAAEWGGPFVALKWMSRDELLITYDARARVFKQEPRMRSVRVTYRTREEW